jgi:hypothetical protein
MPIDASQVQWDAPVIDPSQVKWDAQPSAFDSILQGARNLGGGAVRGAGSIGATILSPLDYAARAMGVQNDYIGRTDRRQQMDAALSNPDLPVFGGADPSSLLYKGGKLGAEVAGTAGAGGVMANGVRALGATRAMTGLEPIVNGLARGLETGGFRVGDLAGTVAALPARVLTGAATGAATAGLVNPSDTGTGAIIGGTLPAAAQFAGYTGNAIRKAIAGAPASPEVAALAQRAQELGIDIPADRLVNSRPLNAVASSLNYVPLSGRAATEDAMSSQLNRRLSNTFGQDSSNVTMALRKAESALGGQFDTVLKNNNVRVDPQFMQDLAESANRASRELGTDGASIIGKQVDDILSKAGNGEIDGQAAYNIKRTLDRIGQRNSPEAYYANDLKKSLMGALNRSLGPDQAAAFAQTRQQYGNMLDLQKLAKNGAEGEVSVARLANMRGINNPQMQELADIAAQFVKPREGAHGAAQRVFGAGGLLGAGAMIGGPVGAALGAGIPMAAGRAANGLLNSQMARNFVLGAPMLGEPQSLGLLTQGAYHALPLIPAQ